MGAVAEISLHEESVGQRLPEMGSIVWSLLAGRSAIPV
jgi:hypothetical protein